MQGVEIEIIMDEGTDAGPRQRCAGQHHDQEEWAVVVMGNPQQIAPVYKVFRRAWRSALAYLRVATQTWTSRTRTKKPGSINETSPRRRPRRMRVVLGRGRLPAGHITTTEDIAMTTRVEFLEHPLAGNGHGHQVTAITRRELEA